MKKICLIITFSAFVIIACASNFREPHIWEQMDELLPDRIENCTGTVREVYSNFFVMEDQGCRFLVSGVTNLEQYKIPLLCSKAFMMPVHFVIFVFLGEKKPPSRQIVFWIRSPDQYCRKQY
jgi:hypothetical protein